MSKTYSKFIEGYVEQVFNEAGECIEQKFVAGDHVEWQVNDKDLLIECPDDSWYQPYDMVQPSKG